jgi:hypothetical protein
LKKLVLTACALAAAIWAVTAPLACGPQQKFCPTTKTGDCPQDTTGGAGDAGSDQGAIIVGNDA